MIIYYLSMKPFERKFFHVIELLNESFIYITSYFLMGFTDFVQSVEGRYTIGSIYFFALCFLIAANMAVIFI